MNENPGTIPPAVCPRCGAVQETGDVCSACAISGVLGSAKAVPPWEPPALEVLAAQLPAFELTGLIGRGGMGAVYRARQRSLEREVAIKVLPPGLDDEGLEFSRRFKAEAVAMARLSHPGIVAVHDSGETPEGLLYIVMEYVTGTDVARMIAVSGRLPPELAHRIVTQVCDALAYAHAHGLVHRDIKPANIMVDTQGRVKVADFGLAKLVSADRGAAASEVSVGTPDFVAPEALVPGAPVDGRADLYAVGVMLYQMITGHMPRGAWEPVSVLVPEVDWRLDAIIRKAMQQNREERHQTASGLRSELDGAFSPPPAGVAAPRAPRRRRVMPAAVGGAVAAVSLAALLWPRQPESAGGSSGTGAQSSPPPAEPLPAEKIAALREGNSLGMKFAPVGGLNVLFCIHETRRQDYAAFARARPELAGTAWKKPEYYLVPACHEDSHPVGGVTSKQADAFCAWLSEVEGITYRLPADREWSLAAGLGEIEPPGLDPARLVPLSMDRVPLFSWGKAWPPPAGAANLLDPPSIKAFWGENQLESEVPPDGYVTTAPVMSFPPGPGGLYDMTGNVSEIVLDWADDGRQSRFTRGGDFHLRSPEECDLQQRGTFNGDVRLGGYTGFRCVVSR